jgi:hypothetical protein
MTGPTYPVRGSVDLKGEAVRFELLRSHETTSDAVMAINAPDEHLRGEMRWRRYKSYDSWATESLERHGDSLIITIPRQPPAGKVMYQVSLIESDGGKRLLTEEPVIIRFKGAVPLFVLIPHIIVMFAAMAFSTRTGLEAIAGGSGQFRLAAWTFALLLVGGMFLGPVMQKYAFGVFWAGWPFGQDLTDTKTAVAILFWLAALLRGRHPGKGRTWIIAAALVTLAVYLVPHSVLGSELDYRGAD